MRNEARDWVKTLKIPCSTIKCTLLAIAVHADDQGVCHPSQRCLRDLTGLSERSVRRAIHDLEGMGLVTREIRLRHDGSRSSDSLQLNLAVTEFVMPARVAGGGASVTGGGATQTPGGASQTPGGATSERGGGATQAPLTTFEDQQEDQRKIREEGSAPAARPSLADGIEDADFEEVEGDPSPTEAAKPAEAAKPEKAKRFKASLCPEDWQPTEAHYAKAAKRGFSRAFVDRVRDRMIDWSHSNAHRETARKSDWGRTFSSQFLEGEMGRSKPDLPPTDPDLPVKPVLDTQSKQGALALLVYMDQMKAYNDAISKRCDRPGSDEPALDLLAGPRQDAVQAVVPARDWGPPPPVRYLGR